MVRRWNQWKNPWDREYAKRGRLWRGRADLGPLPLLAPPPRRVLEVGCGDGKFLRELTLAGYRATGVDFSRHALRLAHASGPCDHVLGDARRLPFRASAFDVVVARYVLGALPTRAREQAARELLRLRGEGGIVLVEDFSTEDFRFGDGHEVEPHTFERNNGLLSHYFEAGEIEALVGAPAATAEKLSHQIRIEGKDHPRVSWRVLFSGNSSSARSA